MYELVGSDGFFTVKQDGDFAHIMVDGDLDYEQNKTFTFYVRIVKDTVLYTYKLDGWTSLLSYHQQK